MAKKQPEDARRERIETVDDSLEECAASIPSVGDDIDEAASSAASVGDDPEPTERERLEAELAGIQAERNALQRREAEIQRALDRLIIEEERSAPAHSNQLRIQEYIKRQQAERKARIERRNAIIAAGIDPSELLTAKAPIDAAMARNRNRGAARPQFATKH